MEIFIGNLPAQATIAELARFLDGIELRPDFQCHEGRDRQDRDYHYFVARAANQEAGRALISRLNGLVFSGQAIEAREYQRRAPCRDWQGSERRVNAW
jgi:hypothetical protein